MKKSVHVVLLLALAAALLGALAGCGKDAALVTGPTNDASSSLVGLHATTAELRGAFRIQESHTPELMRMSGVVGTAITADATGRPAVLVLTETAMGARLRPRSTVCA